MDNPKKHSFTSSSELRRFSGRTLLFLLPILGLLFFIEYQLGTMEFPEAVKQALISEEAGDIEIMFLGSSQVERGINPRFISRPSVNLANSSQRLYENFQLLKKFAPDLPALKLVVLEISYDMLERDASNTSPVLHHKNLKFYKVNSFGRPLKPMDHFLFPSDPEYFSQYLEKYTLGTLQVRLNRYGFDENKFSGSYSAINQNPSLLKDEDIFIENISNEKAYRKNRKLLDSLLTYCHEWDLQVLIYHPPTHHRFNRLRDPHLVQKWKTLLSNLEISRPELHFLIEDDHPDFTMKDFYNGNHLNPRGAEKATRHLDQMIHEKEY